MVLILLSHRVENYLRLFRPRSKYHLPSQVELDIVSEIDYVYDVAAWKKCTPWTDGKKMEIANTECVREIAESKFLRFQLFLALYLIVALIVNI